MSWLERLTDLVCLSGVNAAAKHIRVLFHLSVGILADAVFVLGVLPFALVESVMS